MARGINVLLTLIDQIFRADEEGCRRNQEGHETDPECPEYGK